MTSRLNPYLNFDGTTRQAMEFYHSVFGGTLDITTFGEFGMEGPGSDGVMHANLHTDLDFTLMASDTPPGMPADPPGGSITCSLSGDDEQALTSYWNALAEGGQVRMPLEKQMWGDTFGMCVDRFGIPWMVNIAGSPAA